MCREGVSAFVKKLQHQGARDLEERDWRPVVDGFGDGEGPAGLHIPVILLRYISYLLRRDSASPASSMLSLGQQSHINRKMGLYAES